MGKPDGHGDSSGFWLQDQPSLAQEGRFANKDGLERAADARAGKLGFIRQKDEFL
jgi:hypothetical protein